MSADAGFSGPGNLSTDLMPCPRKGLSHPFNIYQQV
jgi:hypothetical protein